MMQTQVANYPATPYIPPYAPTSWNQHHVNLQHPVNPSTVEGSMVIMPAHHQYPAHNGIGISSSTYHHSKLESISPSGSY